MKPIKAWALVGRGKNDGPEVAGNGDEFQVCVFAERDAIRAYKKRQYWAKRYRIVAVEVREMTKGK